MDRRAHQGHDVHWLSTDIVDVFSAWHEAYEKVRIQRQIVFLKPDAWLIYDVVTAREYIFQATNCLHGVRPFKNQAPGVWCLDGQPSCLVVCAQPDQIRRTVTGCDYDLRDFGAKAESLPAYQHERHHLKISQWRDIGDARPITFATLLVPFIDNAPDVSLTPLEVRGDVSGQAGGFEVSLNGRRDRVVFNPTGVSLTIGHQRVQDLVAVCIGRRWITLPASPSLR